MLKPMWALHSCTKCRSLVSCCSMVRSSWPCIHSAMSSANSAATLDTPSQEELIMSKKSSGDSTDPCGTPSSMSHVSEDVLSTTVFCSRPVRKSSNHHNM